MAVNLALTCKTSNKVVSALDVDKEICALLNITQSADLYGGEYGKYDWYNTIGFQLASGKTYDEVRLHYVKSSIWCDELSWLLKIINHLEEKYEPKSWYSC
jgi:hypothetical protein